MRKRYIAVIILFFIAQCISFVGMFFKINNFPYANEIAGVGVLSTFLSLFIGGILFLIYIIKNRKR